MPDTDYGALGHHAPLGQSNNAPRGLFDHANAESHDLRNGGMPMKKLVPQGVARSPLPAKTPASTQDPEVF